MCWWDDYKTAFRFTFKYLNPNSPGKSSLCSNCFFASCCNGQSIISGAESHVNLHLKHRDNNKCDNNNFYEYNFHQAMYRAFSVDLKRRTNAGRRNLDYFPWNVWRNESVRIIQIACRGFLSSQTCQDITNGLLMKCNKYRQWIETRHAA